MTKTADFSIILSTLNAADTLQAALDSYASQTFLQRELIVIDGGSTDGTVDIIRANEALLGNWISEPDNGIADAWNKAISLSRGTWLNFIGADDEFADTMVLENVATFIEERRKDELIGYGHIDYVDEAGSVYDDFGADWDTALKTLDSEMSIPHPGMFHHRSLFRNIGHFDESFKIAADYDLLLRARRSNTPLYFGPLTVVRKTRGGVSMELSSAWVTAKEVRRAQINNNCYSLQAKIKFLLKVIGTAIYSTCGRRTTEWLVDRYRKHILHRPPRFR